MRIDPQAGVPAPTPVNRRRRRRGGRLQQEGLNSSLGPVLDLSVTGMRLICRRVPAGVITVELYGLGGTLTVQARPIWSTKVGVFKRQVGFEFIDLSEDDVRTLTQLCTAHRFRLAM